MDKRAILRFVEELYRLKRTPRSGYWYYGIEEPESVASHVFGVLLWTYFLTKCLEEEGESVNLERALLIALFHETGEAKLGDLHLEARRYLGEENVRKAEKEAVSNLTKILGDWGSEIEEFFDEFEEGKTREAILVRVADKLELLTQAVMYEKSGFRNLEEILEEAFNRKDFHKISCVQEIVKFLEEMRNE